MTLWTDKVCVVALGNEQKYQTDYNETFTLIAKMTTVHTILALAASQSWLLFHMDVKNAFLQSDLKEEVYMQLPLGLIDPSRNSAYRLRWSLYGLKQAPKA